jgi:hypothetical protein
MALREGRWDCPTCGGTANLGRDVRCPGCGEPRPEGVRFYLPADEPEIDGDDHRGRATAGADWICEHCSGSARSGLAHCPGCGAERGSSPEQRTAVHALGEVPRSGERRAAPPEPPPPASRRVGGAWRLAILLLAVGGGMQWWNAPRTVEATVAEKRWERSVVVERYRTVQEDGWTLPAGARQLRSERAVRDYRQVVDRYESRTRQVSERVQVGTRSFTCGQRDLGNGYFQDVTCTEPTYETRYRTERYQEPIHRREPVYGTRFTWEIRRWVPEDTLRADGVDASVPAWPEPPAGPELRAGARTEAYHLRFAAPRGRTYDRESDAAEYARLAPGERVRLGVRRGGRSVELLRE